MSPPDLINSIFVASAGFFVLDHSRNLLRDKQAKGVSLLAVIFFPTLGFWSLYYYSYLNQPFSFLSALFLTFADSLWLVLIIYYRRKNK